MGIRLRNKVDLQLSLEARQMWKEDELFKEFFHNTGRVRCIFESIETWILTIHSSIAPTAKKALHTSNKPTKPSWTQTLA